MQKNEPEPQKPKTKKEIEKARKLAEERAKESIKDQ